jgi:hypothetical protein
VDPKPFIGLVERQIEGVSLGTGCVLWGGYTNEKGYGVIYPRVNGRTKAIKVHRLVFAAVNNMTLDQLPKVIRHACDNPRCINAKHLLPGTQADNMRDMADRKRWGNQSARLSYEAADEIRARAAKGEKQTTLAAEYRTSAATISMIVNNLIWRTDNGKKN